MTTRMTKPRIYVDAVPEKIIAQEQYTYEITISAFPDTEFKQAKASIELDVPYDGDRCFSKDAVHNIEEEPFHSNEHEHVSGFIGHLALGAAYNWETDLSRPAQPTIYPIEIPLQMGDFNQEQWDTDEWRAKVTEEYSLEDLHFPPIEIEIELFDDPISSPATPFEEFIQQRLKNNKLEGAMVFDFVIRIPLPQMVERKGISVLLEELELAWLTIAAPWQMSWFIQETRDGKERFVEKSWQYDTKRCAIFLENIPTERQVNDAQSPLAYYKSHLRMLMILPGLFVPGESNIINSNLNGKVKVRIDNLLLSGREIAWMGADGYLSKKDPPKLILQTEILAQFSAMLAERFPNRSLTTYRQWIFPGVDLTDARASDVAAALLDLGYRLRDMGNGQTIIPNRSNDTLESARMVAEKIDQMSERNERASLKIEIQIKRIATATTERKREFKGMILSTNLSTSDLMVQLRGTIGIAGSLLDRDTAQLMKLLSKRFAHVTDLR